MPERLATLERMLDERGRRRGDVVVSICPYLRGIDTDKVLRYRDVGVDQLIVMAFATSPDQVESTLDGLVSTVLQPLA